MELALFGTGFHHTFNLPVAPGQPLIIRASNSELTTDSTSLLSQSLHDSLNISAKPPKTSLISSPERQSAVLDIQQSIDLVSALARSGGKLKVQDLNKIMRYFGELKRLQALSQVFQWMQKNGKISSSSYSSYIKLMGRNLNPTKALELYNGLQHKSMGNNVSICNSVLACLIRNGKFESSLKLFNQMKQNGLLADAITYSTLLSGCIKAKNGYAKAMELVQEMEHNGLKKDGVIYGTILAVCASNNQCGEAERYFQQMKDEGHCPNLFHYSSLLNAYSADGNHKMADELVDGMKSEGLVPNKVILTTLLKVYVRGGLFEKSRDLLSELEAMGYADDEMPYCLLMDGLAKAGHIQEAKSIFDEMMTKRVNSDGYSHSIMISAFCRGGLLDEAKKMAKEFEATYDKYDLVISNTMLCAYCRAGEMESVMQMLKKMDELAISPDWNTFHILIKYFCKQKLYLLAYRTIQDMHSKGHQPEEELCSSLIFYLGKVGAHSEAFDVYNMLRYSKRTVSRALHEKILYILIGGKRFKDAYVVAKDNTKLISKPAMKKFARAFMKLGNINLINDVLKAIHNSGFNIDEEVFRMAISRYIAVPEKKELFLQLLKWMPVQGYVVDAFTRNLILKNSDLFGRQLIAELLSKQHKVSKASRSH